MYCDKYKYAGTVDAVAKINGRVCVIDFKTSKKIYKPYHLQSNCVCTGHQTYGWDEALAFRYIYLGLIETGKFEHKVFEPKA